MPNLSEIGEVIVEISWFFDFSRWDGAWPPSWIFNLWKSQQLATSSGPRCITMPYFIEIIQEVAKISDFSIFQDVSWPPSWFFKFRKS